MDQLGKLLVLDRHLRIQSLAELIRVKCQSKELNKLISIKGKIKAYHNIVNKQIKTKEV